MPAPTREPPIALDAASTRGERLEMSSRLRGVPCVGIHKDAHIFCEILARLEISRIAPWSQDADLSGEMALSANILACSLGQLRRVGNGCMSARCFDPGRISALRTRWSAEDSHRCRR